MARKARWAKERAEGRPLVRQTPEQKTREMVRYLSKLRVSGGKRLWTPEFRAEMEQVASGRYSGGSFREIWDSMTEKLERFEAA